MYSRVIEAQYPLNFREVNSIALGKHLKHRHSVTMIGMKRVGISNFLRFFFSHLDARKTYIQDKEKHVYIVVDLNDLIEREIFPFWTLTLKRIADTVEKLDMSPEERGVIEVLFLKSIQIQDHFVTMDSVRSALDLLFETGYLPTLFFVHFDRIKEKVTPAFFDNLEGLLNATGNKLSYVFTSFRPLVDLSPEVFSGNPLPFYCENMYLPLASLKDMETIFTAYNSRYRLKLAEETKKELFKFVNGHIQYLQLSLLTLREHEALTEITPQNLLEILLKDERITLQSEELWESLSDIEKAVLFMIVKKEKFTDKKKNQAAYLWSSQLVLEARVGLKIFNPLFEEYIKQVLDKQPSGGDSVHFTKKENAVFAVLKENVNEICERDSIIAFVWPEYIDAGVSDWAIDRLVARVRTKLREQRSKYEIKTIRTRGYQLVER